MLINHLIDGVCMDPLILAMIIEGLGGGGHSNLVGLVIYCSIA